MSNIKNTINTANPNKKHFQPITINKNNKILVVGDLMLDQYLRGNVSRISPEAPVPVVNLTETENRIGGSGNVVTNIKTLGQNVAILGIIGDDENGQIISDLLHKKDIHAHLIKVKNHPTTTKLRVLSINQQLLRLDREQKFVLTESENKTFIEKFTKLLDEVNIVIFSDYAKGTLSNIKELIQIAKQKNVLIILDPKLKDFSNYAGANIITPNFSEFEAVVGPCSNEQEITTKGLKLLEQFNCNVIVLTRGAKGLTIIEKNATTNMESTSAEVYDVTGAGDTVIATIAVCINSGMNIIDASSMANYAAGIVVSKVGTSSVTLKEIKQKIKQKLTKQTGVMNEDQLIKIINHCKQHGEKIVFTNGCYDVLHYGHIRYFERAKALGDRLIVGVNSDASIKKLKGDSRPINTLDHRMEVLAGLRAVDWVVSFNETTPGNIVKKLSPDVLVKTNETFKTAADVPESEGAHWVLSNGGEIHLLSRTDGCSSTEIVEKMAEAETA